ncbi:MAG: C25 family cysteine peptidase [Bacteroidota bacterium]
MKISFTKISLTLFTLFLFISAFAQQSNECWDPQVRVLESSRNGIEFEVRMPCIEFYNVKTTSGDFQRINANPRYQSSGDRNAGKPEIISYATFIALPIGSSPGQVTIRPTGKQNRKTNVRLFPVQKEETTPEGQERKPLFEFDQRVYNQFRNDVTKPTDVRAIQQGQNNIYKVVFDLVNYQPSEGVLTWHDTYIFRLEYLDPSDCYTVLPRVTQKFQPDALDKLNRRQAISVVPGVINRQDLLKLPCPGTLSPLVFGCDLLIITHPDFLTSSNNLESHKESRGVRTVVVSTQTISDKYGNGSGDVTDTEIKDYIKWYHSSALIKPRWLLLVGDSEFIPTHYNMDIVLDISIAAGDQYYGQLNDDDLEIPAMGIGRFPVDTDSESQTIVDKIIAYETSPPVSIRKAYSFAVQFQDSDDDSTADREFTETAEFIRDYVITQGVDVERIYKDKSSADPLYYDDGRDIPAEIKKPIFAWDGDEVDIYTAINDGRLLVFHRDHGSKNGWSTPKFKLADIDDVSISGTEYPFVFSINCSSGLFDNETINDPAVIVGSGHTSSPNDTYFSEKFIRRANGAIGVICDGRASSTSMNNKMSKGLFDAYFPGLETYGGTGKISTMGDVLNHAKGYVLASSSDNWAIEKENTIYNLFGDPSLSVNGGKVLRFTRIIGFIPKFDNDFIHITLQAAKAPEKVKLGQIPVVIQDPKSGKVLGRAVTNKDGVAKFKMPDNYKGQLKVTSSGANRPMFSEVINNK